MNEQELLKVHEPVVMFLQKDGVYGHGVFWIGTNEAEGRKAADNAASLDDDDYHSWNLYRFKNQQHFASNASHEIIYTARKNVAHIN